MPKETYLYCNKRLDETLRMYKTMWPGPDMILIFELGSWPQHRSPKRNRETVKFGLILVAS